MYKFTPIERFRENEHLARKFHEVESRILSVLNFQDFFERLLTEISAIFDIPLVWFSFLEESDVARLICQSTATQALRERMNLIDRTTFLRLVDRPDRPLLANEHINAYSRLLPPRHGPGIGSLAVAPVTLDGELVGGLGLAAESRTRYAPGLDTVLLERLALKVSLCLSNVTAHEKLKKAARHDSLTGLLNREAMEGVLQREFERARRYSRPLSVSFIDLDDFQSINDTYGHDCGDLLLRHLAEGLTGMCRNSDLVTRHAGDEFVLILPETPKDRAIQSLRRMQAEQARRPLTFDGRTIAMTVSYGVASTEDETITDVARLLKVAHQTLYAAKSMRKKDSEE